MKINLLDKEGQFKEVVYVSYWSILKAYLLSALGIFGVVFLIGLLII